MRYTVKEQKEVFNGKVINKGWVIYDNQWRTVKSKFISHNYKKTLEICEAMNRKDARK